MAYLEQIKHIVVLMLENHSFDQMLGSFQELYPNLEGIDSANLRSNCDYPNQAQTIAQTVCTKMACPYDPMHEHINVMRQIAGGCGGFVSDYAQTYPMSKPDDRSQIMG